jgi:UDPglucose 6-dehydrogenase
MSTKRFNIAIVGNGIVGNATAVGFAPVADVRIYDKFQSHTEPLEAIIPWADIAFICVPTPTDFAAYQQDLSIVDSAVQRCVSLRKDNELVIAIKSTVTPGTTQRLIQQLKYQSICFNPEFLTERSAYFDFINTARVIVGGNDKTCDIMKAAYKELFHNRRMIYTTTAITAELVKYAANCFFAVKVMFFNEIAAIAKQSNVNYNELIDMVLADGRIGNSHINVAQDGNLGFGGKCFPKDIVALIAYAQSLGIEPEVMKAAWQENLATRQHYDWLDIVGASTQSQYGDKA